MVTTLDTRPGDIARSALSPSFVGSLAFSVLGPALFSLAFAPFDLSAAGLVALVPLFLLWSRLSLIQALCWGWVSGTLMFLAILYWTSVTVFQFVGPWSALVLFLLCAIEGTAVAATAVTASLVARGQFRLWSIFAISAAWTLFEYVRTNGSLGVPFGELGLIAAHAPWLLPVAAFGGVYLVTTVVVLVNAALAALLVTSASVRTAGTAALVAVAAIVAAANAYPAARIPAAVLKVGVVQGNVEQQSKWAPEEFAHSQAVYADLTRHAASRGARVVVWPETAITESAPQDKALLATLGELTKTNHIWLLAGTLDSPSLGADYNALLNIAPGGSVDGVYHKHMLVPFAEYLPLAGILRNISLADSTSSFLRGSGPHALSAAGLQWGPLICYESAFAPYARAAVNAGADILVVVTDDAWFNDTPEPYQHLDAAVVQSVATGRWIVRAASTGVSAIINPQGKIVSALRVGEQGVLIGTVGKGITTPFDRYGVTWLLDLSFIIVALGLLSATRAQRTKPSR